MLMQHGFDGGGVDVAKRRRLTDEAILRVRSRQMYVMKLEGQSSAMIAVYFSLTTRHVNREIRAIPEAEKRRIEGRYHRGQVA